MNKFEKHDAWFKERMEEFLAKDKEIDDARFKDNEQLRTESNERWESHIKSINFTMSPELEEQLDREMYQRMAEKERNMRGK